MRRYVHPALIIALAASLPAASARANPIEFLDRIMGFAEEAFEDTVERTGVVPDGPPPFRVGLMLPRSGPHREAAARVARGWEIALGISDNHMADRRIRLVLGDTSKGQGKALQAAERMSRKRPIDVFAGVIGANMAGTMARYTQEIRKPLVLAGAVGENVMSQACYDHVARTSFNIGPYQTTSGRFFASQFKTLVTVGPQSKGGYRLIRRFAAAYREAGGRIIEQAWATTGRKYDWSALLARSAQSGPQAIYAFFEGRNAERIVHQHSKIGLKSQMALIGPEWLFGPRALNRRSKHATGARFLTSYLPERNTSENRLFVENYRKAYREDPDAYAYMGYENALAVLLTAADLNGQTYDGAAFIAAMKKVSYFGLMPRGEFALNGTNSAFLKRLYLVEAVKVKRGNRLKQLSILPIDPDTSVCKKQTAQNRN
jgi:branched-chain amino acid transport system substrate-binding protein